MKKSLLKVLMLTTIITTATISGCSCNKNNIRLIEISFKDYNKINKKLSLRRVTTFYYGKHQFSIR